MKRIKLSLLFLLLSGFVSPAMAQDSKPHEIGLRGRGLSDLGFVYKKQNDKGNYWRYRVAAVNLAHIPNVTNDPQFNASFSFSVGLEKRKSLNSKLSILHGFEPFVFAGTSTFFIRGYSTNYYSLNAGLGYVLGFQYQLNNDFYISVESIPSISVGVNAFDHRGPDFLGQININAQSVATSLVYQF